MALMMRSPNSAFTTRSITYGCNIVAITSTLLGVATVSQSNIIEHDVSDVHELQ